MMRPIDRARQEQPTAPLCYDWGDNDIGATNGAWWVYTIAPTNYCMTNITVYDAVPWPGGHDYGQ